VTVSVIGKPSFALFPILKNLAPGSTRIFVKGVKESRRKLPGSRPNIRRCGKRRQYTSQLIRHGPARGTNPRPAGTITILFGELTMRSMVFRAMVCFAVTVGGLLTSSAPAGEPDVVVSPPAVSHDVSTMVGGWDAGVVIVRHAPTGAEGWQGGWQPGGYEGRVGRPYYYSVNPYGFEGQPVYGPQVAPRSACGGCATRGGWSVGGWWGAGDPYAYHFGPGFYRRAEYGHYRFPYYTYRAPWYFPGHPVYNRDTNFAW
jgi:hypothetical protein